tara:strand:- start:158 stop:472 length:315 start_codon:yes stop_codon:yes gene_type:complete
MLTIKEWFSSYRSRNGFKFNQSELKFIHELRRDLVRESKCAWCGDDVNIMDFEDAPSIREYEHMSGMCKSCQDKTFTASTMSEDDEIEHNERIKNPDSTLWGTD